MIRRSFVPHGSGRLEDTLGKKTHLTRKKAGVIVVSMLLIVAVIVVLWSDARQNEHAQWMVDLNYAQTFGRHIVSAFVLLESSDFEKNTTAQHWTQSEIDYADASLSPLESMYVFDQDTVHANMIFRIRASLENLEGCGSCIFALNLTLRVSLANLLHSMSWRLVGAYSNFLNYTSADSIRGPSIWYFGPAPPDEGQLQLVVALAANLKLY